jgi:hypothetical protein
VTLAKPAVEVPAYIKMLLWGEAGSGKTRLALSFDRPLVADLEHGSHHYAAEFGHWMASPKDTGLNPVELVEQLAAEIAAGAYPDRKTLVIDPATIWIDAVELDWQRKKGINNMGDLQGMKKAAAYAAMKEHIEAQVMKLVNLDMNVVFIARQKNVWTKTPEGMAPTGKTYDGRDSLEYLTDIVINIKRGGTAEVQKSRLAYLDPTIKLVKFHDLAALLGSGSQVERVEPIAKPAVSEPEAKPPARPKFTTPKEGPHAPITSQTSKDIGDEMTRIGMTVTPFRAHLQKTYNVDARAGLTQVQALELLAFLKAHEVIRQEAA